MAQQQQQQHTTKEMGLLKVAASHKRTAISATEGLQRAEKVIVILAKTSADPEKVVWEYVESVFHWWHGDSARLGVLTTIGDWKLKNGKVIRAHMTEHGNFYRRAEETGEFSKPVPYVGNFHIQRARFQFVMDEQAKTIADFFQPIHLSKRIVSPRKIKRPTKVVSATAFNMEDWEICDTVVDNGVSVKFLSYKHNAGIKRYTAWYHSPEKIFYEVWSEGCHMEGGLTWEEALAYEVSEDDE
jgi:hypothetical protein